MIKALGVLPILVLLTVPAFGADRELETILCEDQGLADTVETLPNPADEWITVVCTPVGQALMPNLDNEYVWLERKSGTAFIVRSFPDGSTPPTVPGKQPSEVLRFVTFAGGQMTEQRSGMAMNLLEAALEGDPLPEIDSVFQLDAYSTWQGMITNLFIYRIGGTPRIMVACRARCQTSAVIDVTTFDELTATIENSNR